MNNTKILNIKEKKKELENSILNAEIKKFNHYNTSLFDRKTNSIYFFKQILLSDLDKHNLIIYQPKKETRLENSKIKREITKKTISPIRNFNKIIKNPCSFYELNSNNLSEINSFNLFFKNNNCYLENCFNQDLFYFFNSVLSKRRVVLSVIFNKDDFKFNSKVYKTIVETIKIANRHNISLLIKTDDLSILYTLLNEYRKDVNLLKDYLNKFQFFDDTIKKFINCSDLLEYIFFFNKDNKLKKAAKSSLINFLNKQINLMYEYTQNTNLDVDTFELNLKLFDFLQKNNLNIENIKSSYNEIYDSFKEEKLRTFFKNTFTLFLEIISDHFKEKSSNHLFAA